MDDDKPILPPDVALVTLQAAITQSLETLIGHTVTYLRSNVSFKTDENFDRSARALVLSWLAGYVFREFKPEDMVLPAPVEEPTEND